MAKAKPFSRIRGRIRELGYSQAEVADKIPMSRASFNGKLNCKTVFTADEIAKVANLLEISVQDIGIYFFDR